MTDASLKAFVNELDIKCPHCGGSVKVNRVAAGEVLLDHYFNIPGEKIVSNLPACHAFDTEVTNIVVSFKNNLMQLHTLRENLTKISTIEGW